MPANSAKCWCFTLHSNEMLAEHFSWPTAKVCPIAAWYDRPDDKGLVYMVCQVEKAPGTGKVHIQGYMSFSARTSLANLKRMFSAGAHWEVARGTPKENQEYCQKEKSRLAGPWEYGTLPQGQGSRSDLRAVYQMVKERKTNYDILEASEGKAAKFSKAIQFMEFACAERDSDRQATGVNVYVLYGATGTTLHTPTDTFIFSIIFIFY